MTSFMNKVKDALRSSRDTPSEGNTRRTWNEEPNPVAANDNAATDPGPSTLPGSFPAEENSVVPTHHKDGREYVAPTGTHIEAAENDLGESTERGVPEPISINNGTTGDVPPETSNRYSMDPASKEAESNAMDTQIAGSIHTTGTSATREEKTGPNKLRKKNDPRRKSVDTRAPSPPQPVVQPQQAVQPVQPTEPTYNAQPARVPQTLQPIQLTQNTQYNRAAQPSSPTQRTGYGDHGFSGLPSRQSSNARHTPASSQAASGSQRSSGLYETASTHQPAGAHAAPGRATGSNALAEPQAASTTTHNKAMTPEQSNTKQANYTTIVATSTQGHDHTSPTHNISGSTPGPGNSSNGRFVENNPDVYDQQASRSYAGEATPREAQDQNSAAVGNVVYPNGLTSSQSTAYQAYNTGTYSAGANLTTTRSRSHKSRKSTDSHRGMGIYNGVAGAGSPDGPERERRSLEKSRAAATSGITTNAATASLPVHSTKPYPTTTDQPRKEAGDPRSRVDSGYAADTGMGVGAFGSGGVKSSSSSSRPEVDQSFGGKQSTEATIPSSRYSISAAEPAVEETTVSQEEERNVSQTREPAGSNFHHHVTSSNSGPGGVGGERGLPVTTTANGIEDTYQGPGLAGSKVMHKCTNCGQDNDITYHFRREVTYRLSK